MLCKPRFTIQAEKEIVVTIAKLYCWKQSPSGSIPKHFQGRMDVAKL